MKRNVLVRPFVTEKMTQLMESGHYAFVVEKNANKVEIRKAIEAHYPHVKVKEVRTLVVRGKRKRQFTRRGLLEGRRSGYKKAIVTLMPDSEQIDFFENV
jgi:large subunit ribosomal protein L23